MAAATTTKASLNTTQRAWLKKMGAALDAPAADVRVAFGPTDLIDPLKKLTEPHSCQVRVVNESGQPLKLDPLSIKEVDDEKQIGLSHGKYDSMPPNSVAAKESGEFKASSNTVLGQTLTGVEGRVRFFLDDQKTAWIIHFNNPFKGKNTADVLLDGPNKAQFESPKPDAGSGNDAVYLFTLKGKGGGGGPEPKPPGPGPAPGVDAASSCHVTITNDTKLTLTLGGQGHERGDFMTFPAKTLAPGASTNFVSVETPNAKDGKDEGCKGFLLWQVGAPNVLWRVEWDNPEQTKNVASASFNPANAGFTSLNQIGQGEENVPTSFTISGGGGVTPPPGSKNKFLVTVLDASNSQPIEGATIEVDGKSVKTGKDGKTSIDPSPPPGKHKYSVKAEKFKPASGEVEVVSGQVTDLTELLDKEGSDVTPPPESKQPTLRRGDKSDDKWVEYLQTLLKIDVDGKFGPGTEKAVREFQTKNKLQVDGIVGNQTWAALRGNEPEKPSTDGRKPHTFVEKGPEARWFTEDKNIASYDKARDEVRIVCVSLGDAKIDDFNATVQVAKSGASTSGFKKPPAVFVKIGPSFKELPKGVGFLHAVRIQKFRATHGSGRHTIEAFLPLDLGGDNWKGDVEVQ